MSATKKQLQANAAEKSGHSRRLRAVLKAAREQQGMSARDLADRIAEHLTRLDRALYPDAPAHRPKHSNTIYMWERFENHPSISDFAAWARVLGYRLIVDLDDAHDGRTSVLLDSREAVHIARTVDMWPVDKRASLLAVVEAMDSSGGQN